MISNIGSVAVLVSDAEKSKKWYVEKLGFKVRSEEEHWITVSPSDSSVALHLCETDQLEPGNTGITLQTNDVDATYKTLKQKGVQFARELAPSEFDPNWKYAMLKDPDGNEFWLVASD